MRTAHCIGLDVHREFVEYAIRGRDGRVLEEGRTELRIPALLEALQQARKPRWAVLEEGPLSGWLCRSLRKAGEDVRACDPRRNALINKDGQKSDKLDARRLAELAQNNSIREVHHPDDEHMAAVKSRTAIYHDSVNRRVAAGHRLAGHLAKWGLSVRQKDLRDGSKRQQWLASLPSMVQEDLEMLGKRFDAALEEEEHFRSEAIALARQIPVVRRFTALPGIGWIRALTFYAYVQTPFRFKKPSKLWVYMGIGLQARGSGQWQRNGTNWKEKKHKTRLAVPTHANRRLKAMIMSAASDAIQADNPFKTYYERRLAHGARPQVAKRDVARLLAKVMWGMWKSGTEYRPESVLALSTNLHQRSQNPGSTHVAARQFPDEGMALGRALKTPATL